MSGDVYISISANEHRQLADLHTGPAGTHRQRRRAEVVLLAANGLNIDSIIRKTGRSKRFCWLWLGRFTESGFEALLRNKRRSAGLLPLRRRDGASLTAQTTLLLAKSLVPVQCFAELASIESPPHAMPPNTAVLNEASWQGLCCPDEFDLSAKQVLGSLAEGENSIAAHVTFGMSKFRFMS